MAALVLGGLGLLVLYGVAIWRAPEFLTNQDVLDSAKPEHRLPAEYNARLIVVSVGGALVVAIGLLYTARNYRLAHRGQVTERFTKALERLGSDELYVRIGGVQALAHVMRDSPEHHADVVEVLVAFIRAQAPRSRVEEPVQEQWMHPPIGTDVPELPTEPAADVQVALTALGQRPQRPKHERGSIDLSQLHLQGVRLEGAQLQGALLKDVQLQDALLKDVQLQDALLKDMQLQDAWLISVNLQGASLTNAQLQGALLINAQLQGASLMNAQLQGALISDVQLFDPRLKGAHLQGALLISARVRYSLLTNAQFQSALLMKMQRRDVLPKAMQISGSGMWNPKGIGDRVLGLIFKH